MAGDRQHAHHLLGQFAAACSIGKGSYRSGFPAHTLAGEPAFARASTLSSKSKPAVRGLWLRVYHL